MLTPQQCLLRCFPLGSGGFVWSLPPSDLTLSFPFSPPAAFLHICLKDGWLSQPTCSAGLFTEHSTFSVGRAFPLGLQFSHLVEAFCLVYLLMRPPRYYVQGALGNTPSPGWGQTPSGVPDHQLMSGVRISRGM